MPDESGQLTFTELERQLGGAVRPEQPDPFPLEAWYRAVRGIPLRALSAGDIARACRQQLFVEHVVPLAVAKLEANPLEGSVYDGELLVSLKAVPLTYWSQHAGERQAVVSIAERVLASPDILADLRSDAEELRAATSGVPVKP